MSWFEVSDRGWPSDQTLAAFRVTLDSQETVGVEAYAAVPEHCQLVDRVPDDESLRCESRVEPIQRGLTLLEVMQIHPTAAHAIRAPHDIGGRSNRNPLTPG